MAKHQPHEERDEWEETEQESTIPATKKDELITDKSIEDPTKGRSQQSWYWLPIGIAIGAALGAATDNMGVWLGFGVALGVILSVVGNPKKKEH